MRKIFIFWIAFLVVLAAGIILAISSRVALKREEGRAEELRKAVISRPSIFPKNTVVSEPEMKEEKVRVEAPMQVTETALPEPAPVTLSSSGGGEIPSLENDIPVEISTNSLEISVPHPVSQDETPAAGQ